MCCHSKYIYGVLSLHEPECDVAATHPAFETPPLNPDGSTRMDEQV